MMTSMRLLKRSRSRTQALAMRNHLLALLGSIATPLGSDAMLSYREVTLVMDYIDTYWVNNETILFAYIDARSLSQKGYETTGT